MLIARGVGNPAIVTSPFHIKNIIKLFLKDDYSQVKLTESNMILPLIDLRLAQCLNIFFQTLFAVRLCDKQSLLKLYLGNNCVLRFSGNLISRVAKKSDGTRLF